MSVGDDFHAEVAWKGGFTAGQLDDLAKLLADHGWPASAAMVAKWAVGVRQLTEYVPEEAEPT